MKSPEEINCVCVLGEGRQGAFVRRKALADTTLGAVTVQVAYAGLNYKDALATVPEARVIRNYPRIAGSDFSGVVVESADPAFAPGDKVFSCANGIGVERDGGFADYVRVDRDHLRHLPASLSTFEIAALGVAGITAALSVHLLEDQGLVPGAGPVLVTGATGGVGTMAIEMLARRGHRVVALTGKASQELVLRELGACEVITRLPAEGTPKPLAPAAWAGAIDTVGGETFDGLIRSMKPKACIASVGNAAGNALVSNLLPFILRGVRIVGVNLTEYAPLTEVLLARLSDEMKPTRAIGLTQVVGMNEVPRMLQAMLRREITGRIVMRPQQSKP